jgi:hypothetical protein
MTFNDDEIRQHVRQTAGKRKHADYDRQKLMAELKSLALRGDEQAFYQKLAEADIRVDTPQWREAKRAYQAFRQSR